MIVQQYIYQKYFIIIYYIISLQMNKYVRNQKYIPTSEQQQAKYEQINQEVTLKVKLNEVLKDISNLVLSLVNQVQQILKSNQIRFQINRQWAHKIIMNVIAPVQIRAPTQLPTDSTKIFSKIQLSHYNLNRQKVNQKKAPEIQRNIVVKKNRSSYPLLDGISFENADPSKDYPTKLGKDVEMTLNKWIIKEYEQGRIIGGDEIRQRALQMSKKLGIKFQASRGWLRRYFMRNYQIYCLLHNAAEKTKNKNNKKSDVEVQFEEIIQSQFDRIPEIKEQESQLIKKKQLAVEQKNYKIVDNEEKQIVEQKQNGQESCIYISRKDVRKIIKKNMKYLSENDITRIINNLDPSNSGRISEFDLENLDNLSL